MKLAFIADIHGNAVALEAVLQDIEQRNVDQIFVLGDLCFRGPEPKRALSMVQALDTHVIKGNADEWVVRGVRRGEVPNQAYTMMDKERDWTHSRLNEADKTYLHQLSEELHLAYDNCTIHAFHATPNSLFDVIQPNEGNDVLRDSLIISEADVYIYAHIHQGFIRYIDGKCLINTGSVGLPFDGLNSSSYTILDIEENSYQSSIVRVSYDIERVIEQIKASDYPNKEFLIRGIKNGKVS